MRYFNFNGDVYKENQPIIGPECRGLRYGDGIFETMKWDGNNILFAADHFARLWKGMEFLQIDFPKWFTPAMLTEHIRQLIQKNNFYSNVRIRLQVFRGSGGLYDATNNLPNFIIETWPLSEKTILNSNGIVAGIYRDVKKNCDNISNIKSTNFLPYVLAALHAKKEKWNDAILLNTCERVCESTKANIFIIKKEAIVTPILSEGCIAGIMRKSLIQKLTALGWTLKETIITEEDLKNAEEVFISNVIINMQWVKQIGSSIYTNKQVQKIYAQLFS